MNRQHVVTGIWVALACMAEAQTAIDLRTQSRSVDFSAASFTKPLKTGTVLPPACTVGEMFFQTTAPAGQNLFGCTAANRWTVFSGGGAGAANYSQAFTGQTSVTLAHNLGSANVLVQCYDTNDLSVAFEDVAVANANSAVVTFATPQSGRCVVNGSGGGATALGGDLNGTAPNARVVGIAGRMVAATAPADQQVLQWSAAQGQWQPGAPAAAVTAGAGLAMAGSQMTVDTAVMLTSLNYTDSWGFNGANVANAACSALRTVSAPGASTGDRIAAGSSAGVTPGVFVIANVTGPGTITYQVCNLSGVTAAMTGNTYQFSIFRSF